MSLRVIQPAWLSLSDSRHTYILSYSIFWLIWGILCCFKSSKDNFTAVSWHSNRYRPGIFAEFPCALDRGGFGCKGPKGDSSHWGFQKGKEWSPVLTHSPQQHCKGSCPWLRALLTPPAAAIGSSQPRIHRPAKPHSKATLSAPVGTEVTKPTTSWALPSQLLPRVS